MGGMEDMPTGGADAMGNMEGLAEAMGNMDMGELLKDPSALLKGLDPANNPLLKGLADANPELAQMLSDPNALAEQMQQMTQLMQSEEGQQLAQNMMTEMQSILTDPEKLKTGLEQLGSNPALAGLADAVPGLREMLDDPEALQEQASKTAELFQDMQDPEKVQEMLAQLGGEGGAEGLAALQEAIGNLGADGGGGLAEMQQKLLEAMSGSGGGGGALDDMLRNVAGALDDTGSDANEDGDVLQNRVRAQLAAMMNQRRANNADVLGDDDNEMF